MPQYPQLLALSFAALLSLNANGEPETKRVDPITEIPEDVRRFVEAAKKSQTGNRDLELLAGEFPKGAIFNNQLARLRLECTRNMKASSAAPRGMHLGKVCDAVLIASAEETARMIIANRNDVSNPLHLLSVYYAAELNQGQVSEDASNTAKEAAALARATRLAESASLNTTSGVQACSGPRKETCTPLPPGQSPMAGQHLLSVGNATDAGFTVASYSLFRKGKHTALSLVLVHADSYLHESTLCRQRSLEVGPDACLINGHGLASRTVPTIVERLLTPR